MTNLNGVNWVFILLAIAGGFLPTIFWLWFWLHEDKKKLEPKRVIARTFIVGGFFVPIVFIIDHFFLPSNNLVTQISTAYKSNLTLSAIILVSLPLVALALIEELSKYLAARIGALRNINCDEPIDVMIYMITAALGFSAVENSLFLFSLLITSGPTYSSFLFTGNLRFLGATLLHTVTSATLGAFLGFAFYQKTWVKTIAWILGLATATTVHLFFNFFIITGGSQNVLPVLIGLWVATMFIIFIFEIIRRLNHRKTLPGSTNKVRVWQRW